MVGRLNPNWIVPTAPRGTSDNRAASTAFVTGGGGAGPRIVLAVATTFYIATNGSDTNDGLTPATAWLTFAHAIAVLTSLYDFGGQTVTFQAVAGHANFTTGLTISPWVGGGSFTYDGNGGSIATTSGPAILDQHVGLATVKNVTLSSSDANNGFGLDVNCLGQCFIGDSASSGVVFATSASVHMRLRNPGGQLWVPVGGTTYSTSGGAKAHIQVTSGQAVFEGAQVTHNNVTTFSVSFLFMAGGFIFAGGNFNVTNQTIHGKRFTVNLPAAVLETHGNLTFFPGDVAGTGWAGTTTPGPEYA